jgi:glycosyltransferase involved in cell wall biosynthesis
MSNVKITVAILAYYKDFLDESISSVLNQTYSNLNVVVYDDCSPYDLESVVNCFDDPRLSYVRNAYNLGSYGNSNQALQLCNTEYISIFHGDDRMFPWMIENIIDVFEKHPNIGLIASE